MSEVKDFGSITGKGIKGNIGGKNIFIGNTKILELVSISADEQLLQSIPNRQTDGETVMFVLVNNEIAGYISVADPVKKTSAKAIHEL